MLTDIAMTKGYVPPSNLSLVSALSVLEWSAEYLKRKTYSLQEYERFYGKRSAKQIIDDRFINFYLPCIDVCSVAGQLLQEAEFPTSGIIFESHNFFEHRSFHMRLQCKTDNGTYMFSPGRMGTYYFPARIDKRVPALTIDFKGIQEQWSVLEQVLEGGIYNLHEVIPGLQLSWLHCLWAMKNTQIKLAHTKSDFNKIQRSDAGKLMLYSKVTFE